MTGPEHRTPNDTQHQAPPRLAAALKGLAEPEPQVPPEVDAEIRSLARAHFAAVARRRAIRWIPASAAAAAAVLVAVLWFTRANSRSPFDINGDGRVDILDSYALAVDVRDHKESPSLDVNHDGVVDSRDVDAVAIEAVTLPGRRAQ